MRRKVFLTILFAFIASIGLVGVAAAASSQYKENIEDGARFDLSPPAYVVEFSQPVQLTSIELVDQDGVKTLIAPLKRAVRIQFIELPLLAPHGYRLFWKGRISGQDIAGSVGFVVAGCRNERLVTPQAEN